jgi:hypothetical protein
MSEMVDRVAKSMEDAWDKAELGGRLGPITALILARSAIEAMREPTAWMQNDSGVRHDNAVYVWQNMIDSALEP